MEVTETMRNVRDLIASANGAETDALALQPAEDAAQILAEVVSEDEPGFVDAALAVFHVWEQRHLSKETAAREKRKLKMEQAMQRILGIAAVAKNR